MLLLVSSTRKNQISFITMQMNMRFFLNHHLLKRNQSVMMMINLNPLKILQKRMMVKKKHQSSSLKSTNGLSLIENLKIFLKFSVVKRVSTLCLKLRKLILNIPNSTQLPRHLMTSLARSRTLSQINNFIYKSYSSHEVSITN